MSHHLHLQRVLAIIHVIKSLKESIPSSQGFIDSVCEKQRCSTRSWSAFPSKGTYHSLGRFTDAAFLLCGDVTGRINSSGSAADQSM